ncbi:hypothetical protein EB796_007564 [Bugula neritina]|uniref:Uncharacterized protein n=1 Tax=Bugula neritina TaxID=10212 RepID=A0A7J7K996_BUGNE|nr:hypothetical protein EB796_007564 [Bugula neritina]
MCLLAASKYTPTAAKFPLCTSFCDGDNKSYLSSIDLYFRVFKRVSSRVVQPELISLTHASPVFPLCLSHFLHLSSKPTITSLINIQVP